MPTSMRIIGKIIAGISNFLYLLKAMPLIVFPFNSFLGALAAFFGAFSCFAGSFFSFAVSEDDGVPTGAAGFGAGAGLGV